MKEGGIEIIPGFVIAETELRERFSHSPGPGGQGVNTADSRVELMFDVENSGAVPDQLRPIIGLALKNRLVNGVLTVAVHDQRYTRCGGAVRGESPRRTVRCRFL